MTFVPAIICCDEEVSGFCFVHNGFQGLPTMRGLVLRFRLSPPQIDFFERHGIVVVEKKPHFPVELDENITEETSSAVALAAGVGPSVATKHVFQPLKKSIGPFTVLYVTANALLKHCRRVSGNKFSAPHITSDRSTFVVGITTENTRLSEFPPSTEALIQWLSFKVWGKVTLWIPSDGRNKNNYFLTFSSQGRCKGLGRDILIANTREGTTRVKVFTD